MVTSGGIRKHIIHTERDGELGDTTEEMLREIVHAAAVTGKMVLHVHGGLVNRKAGIENAKRLLPFYEKKAWPIFPIWETGALETVLNNLPKIAKEDWFRELLRQLLKWADGLLRQTAAQRARGFIPFRRNSTIDKEIGKLSKRQEPFASLEAGPEAEEPTQRELRRFRSGLQRTEGVQRGLRRILDAALPERVTLMSPEVVAQLRRDAGDSRGGKLGRNARIFRQASSILSRVVRRFLKGRDHGLYATVVEEICRELYIANIGAAIYDLMKEDARQTFEQVAGGKTRGGWYFLERLGEECRAGGTPEVSVVAHSLGSVWTNHFIAAADRARRDPKHPLPKTFRIANVIFLAPAVRFDVFAPTLAAHESVFRDFRMFTMNDFYESGYWEVPAVYPRSLLYMVSGMFETEGSKDTSFDMPLLGMERYHTGRRVYRTKAVRALRAWFGEKPKRSVWSVVSGGTGLDSDAVRHGGFDDITGRKATMESVLSML